MIASIKQMALKRKLKGIPRTEIQRRLDCSYSWVRWLEEGYYSSRDCGAEWRDKYEKALNEAIEDREARVAGDYRDDS